jgi:hypothetical protein
VYWALAGGAFVTVTVLVVIASAGIVSPIPNFPKLAIRIVSFVLLVAGFAVTGMFSGSIPPLQTGQDEGQWWQANSNKAVLTWALAEGTAAIGGVQHAANSSFACRGRTRMYAEGSGGWVPNPTPTSFLRTQR